MTGSFLFVKPSNSKGEPGTEYSGDSPRYPYDHASWEWLLERALRRTLIPWALTKSHSQVILYGHEDKYSLHKWGSYGESNLADVTPNDYQNVGGTGSPSRKTDADLSRDDRETPLPTSWNSYTEGPTYQYTKAAYGITDLEKTVASLPFSLEWLHPDWSSSAVDEWDLTAKTTEETRGSYNGDGWTWTTTVEHVPYEIPDEIPFKCLSHMRTDDPLVDVDITNDDDKVVAAEIAPTPVAAPRSLDGSIRNYHGTQVLSALDGAAYRAGWALSEFYIPYRSGLDYSKSTGSGSYDRDGKTTETIISGNSTLGCLVYVPDEDSGSIIVSSITNEEMARFVPCVDWGGKPTWWHANDFPKGLDSVISEKLKDQLKALCNECQPAIPPAIPAFREKFPDAGRFPWNYSYKDTLFDYVMYPHDWMRHLTLACTPFDMSARLDAMTTTVHRVPTIFAKIRTVRTTSSTSNREDVNSSGEHSWRRSSDRNVVTVEGTSLDPIPSGDGLYSVSGSASSVETSYESSSDPYGAFSSSSKTQRTWEESLESNSDFLVCLRATANTTPTTKSTTETSSLVEYSYADPIKSDTETSHGDIPESYDPDPDDFLFPDWVLPWIETAELFASIESRLGRGTGTDRTESTYSVYAPDTGEYTYTFSGTGSGSRTHKSHRKIVSLGQMDPLTGRFPALDTTSLLSEVDPDPSDPSWGPHWKTINGTSTRTSGSDHSSTYRLVMSYKGFVGDNSRSRSVSYYVVVKWKFDRTDPETLETESPTAGLYRNLDNAKIALSDKKRELKAAEAELATAKAEQQPAEYALERAQKQLDNPESAAPDLFAEAKAEIARAQQKLAEATAKKSSAQPDFDAAKDALQVAEDRLQKAKAEYDAAVESGVDTDAAAHNLEIANKQYYDAVEAYAAASGDLSGAEVDEAAAQQAVDDAQAHYDALLDKITEVLKKAVEAAKAALDEVLSRIDKWTRKVEELEAEIQKLEQEVEEAEQAIRDAGSNGPNS